jgi:hypothetical protein
MAATSPKARHKSFTPKNRKVAAPLTFELYGETLEAWPELQGSTILEFSAMFSSEDEGSSSATLILTFFDRALKPDSLEKFNKVIHDPETIVPAEDLAEIVGWLMQEYTGRDLEDASPSSTNS